MIRPELLSILACPYCDSPRLDYIAHDETEALVCGQCGHSYGFENNIPLMHRDDASWAPKAREAQGWVAMWKDLGLYDQELSLIPGLPFDCHDEPWPTISRMFNAALFTMDLRGGERILDIGAGEGWASQIFAQRGCHAVATDVVADAKLGLGRAWKRMDYTGVVYDLVIADNEALPFQPNTFDFVFSSNTLHHSDHLERLMRSAFRVLRPGGRLISIGDPITSIFQQESDMTDGDREKAHGIIERRRRFHHYLYQLWRVGFRNIHAEDDQTFWKKNHELYPWMDQQRCAFADRPLLGTPIFTRTLAAGMMRLPRPFAVGLLLSLREGGLLMLNAQKPVAA